MTVKGPLSGRDFELYDEVLSFLERACAAAGDYREGQREEHTPRDLFLLSFTKVVNDCRAIVALAERRFYIQGAIVLRSTLDACNMMMHIAYARDESQVAERWLAGERLTHWYVVTELNKALRHQGKLDLGAYEEERGWLDDIVHGNFRGLRLYPAQARGATPLGAEAVAPATFWTPLLDLCVISCLWVVELVSEEGAEQAGAHFEAVLGRWTHWRELLEG